MGLALARMGPRGVDRRDLVEREEGERIGVGWGGAVEAEGRGDLGGGSVEGGDCGGHGRLGLEVLLPWTNTGVGFKGLV